MLVMVMRLECVCALTGSAREKRKVVGGEELMTSYACLLHTVILRRLYWLLHISAPLFTFFDLLKVYYRIAILISRTKTWRHYVFISESHCSIRQETTRFRNENMVPPSFRVGNQYCNSYLTINTECLRT
jgi:hypothetical protein